MLLNHFPIYEITVDLQKLRVVAECYVVSKIEILLTAKEHLHRKEILAHLTSKGLMGNEKTPMANLAAYLSAWRGQFGTDGKGNFKLRNEAPTSELKGAS